MDPIDQFKASQKQVWQNFAVMETFTGAVAPRIVRFANVQRGTKLLDVACGTGVVALTAARLGALVTGLDLTRDLVARAKQNAELMKLEATFVEGDAEALPFKDGVFDTVVSQFGHMFAPRADVALAEMLRVLRPGGTIAFATWPPELYVGRMLMLMGRYSPNGPPPAGVSPPPLWGDPNVVRQRLGDAVQGLVFRHHLMTLPMLSPAHGRVFFEQSIGPATRLIESLSADPPKLAVFRRELEELIAAHFEDNVLRQDFLLTRAEKR